jgi:hypothetical protein
MAAIINANRRIDLVIRSQLEWKEVAQSIG